MLTVAVAGHVRHKSDESGRVVILDIAAGEWIVLNQTAGELWRSWQAGAGIDQAVSRVVERYPGVPAAAIRADAEQLLGELLARRYMARADHATRPAPPVPVLADQALRADGDRSVGAVMAAPPVGSPPAPLPWGRVALALIFLLAADVLLRCSFRRSVALVRWSRRSWCRSALPAARASGTVEAVRRAACWYPGRAACLERSLAAVLLAIAVRRRLDWCLGAVPDPYRFHAWVAVAGTPVTAADDDPALDQWDLILNA
jgi:transglutaminase superfamily protein/coenzyme PQQ synthesis protein D (PqqD)